MLKVQFALPVSDSKDARHFQAPAVSSVEVRTWLARLLLASTPTLGHGRQASATSEMPEPELCLQESIHVQRGGSQGRGEQGPHQALEWVLAPGSSWLAGHSSVECTPSLLDASGLSHWLSPGSWCCSPCMCPQTHMFLCSIVRDPLCAASSGALLPHHHLGRLPSSNGPRQPISRGVPWAWLHLPLPLPAHHFPQLLVGRVHRLENGVLQSPGVPQKCLISTRAASVLLYVHIMGKISFNQKSYTGRNEKECQCCFSVLDLVKRIPRGLRRGLSCRALA